METILRLIAKMPSLALNALHLSWQITRVAFVTALNRRTMGMIAAQSFAELKTHTVIMSLLFRLSEAIVDDFCKPPKMTIQSDMPRAVCPELQVEPTRNSHEGVSIPVYSVDVVQLYEGQN